MSVFRILRRMRRSCGRNMRRRCSGWSATATPLDVLRDTPGAAARAVATLTPEKLRTPEAPGKWSIAQVLRHLADTDVVWGWRMRLILAQDRPPITGFDQDLWADRLDYAHADPNESLETFAVLRRDNLRLIERATPEDLQARRRARRARRRERRISGAPLRRPRPDASQSDRSHRHRRSLADLGDRLPRHQLLRRGRRRRRAPSST